MKEVTSSKVSQYLKVKNGKCTAFFFLFIEIFERRA
jgi:predicted transcriptional regulator